MTVEEILRNVVCDVGVYRGTPFYKRIVSAGRHMIMPIKGEKLEIPIFALNFYIHSPHNYNYIAVPMVSSLESTYKSLPRQFRDVMLSNYLFDGLVMMRFTQKNTRYKYYGAPGALFDSNFNPLLICSWVLREEADRYVALYPTFRISQKCFVNKDSPVEKLIINKLLPVAVTTTFNSILYTSRLCFEVNNERTNSKLVNFKVIIGDTPFIFKEAFTPTIHTTEQELKDVVMQNLDDFVLT